jgi:hypothetical protein
MRGGPFAQVADADYTIVTPTAVALHKRAAVTGAAALLSSFAALPIIPPLASQEPPTGATAVVLQQESASTGTVYATWDGTSVPTAGGTLGFAIPVAPAMMRLPGVDVVKALKVIASAGTIYLQVYYEF